MHQNEAVCKCDDNGINASAHNVLISCSYNIMHSFLASSEDICKCGEHGVCISTTMKCECEPGYVARYHKKKNKCRGMWTIENLKDKIEILLGKGFNEKK